MNLGKTFALVMSGAAFGIALVLSCSNGPGKSDAATCDCPAAEPPITASRYQVVNTPVTIAANGSDAQDAGCPGGTLFLSGSCGPVNPAMVLDVTLRQARFSLDQDNKPISWHCDWKNNEAFPVDFQASALCLKPQ